VENCERIVNHSILQIYGMLGALCVDMQIEIEEGLPFGSRLTGNIIRI
jgi:hypothetical protein